MTSIGIGLGIGVLGVLSIGVGHWSLWALSPVGSLLGNWRWDIFWISF
jgi:hypothetical protein